MFMTSTHETGKFFCLKEMGKDPKIKRKLLLGAKDKHLGKQAERGKKEVWMKGYHSTFNSFFKWAFIYIRVRPKETCQHIVEQEGPTFFYSICLHKTGLWLTN